MTNPLSVPSPITPRSDLSSAARDAADRLRDLLAQPPDAAALLQAAETLVAALRDAKAAQSDPFVAAGLDRAILARLLALTGDEVAHDLLERLAEDLGAARAALDPGARCPPAPVLRAQGHLLLGLAGSVGALRLHEAALQLNTVCRAAASPGAVNAARDNVVAALDAALGFLALHGPTLPQQLGAAQPAALR